MHLDRRQTHRAALALLLLAVTATPAAAQSYPDKPIKLVIPYSPGGPTDVLARIMADHLGRVLKQSVVADNRPGGGGVIAMAQVARSTPDGYTLLFGDINMAVSPALHKSLPFDPARSFTPIGLVATAPMLVLVPQDSPFRSVRDVVAQAKAAPRSLAYAHGGIGSPTHLGPEVFKARLGLDVISVPYKSSGEALTAVAAGHAQLVFTGLSAARPLIDAGKLRPLAIASSKRSPMLAGVPTMEETGFPLPELNVGSWWGVFAPPNLPPAITRQLHSALRTALASPELSSRLVAMTFSPGSGTPEDLQAWIANEARTWAGVLQRAGINPE
jgi:tripartite-type tricarboxylate transporter receptor subunit TctC